MNPDQQGPARQVCLVGLRGSGKSSVGKALAALLGWPLVDTDTELTVRHGPIAKQFATDGELEFRQREKAVLAECLRQSPLVLSTGGGAVLLEANRELLTQAHTVWLHAQPIELARRIVEDPATPSQRPILAAGERAGDETELERWRREMEKLLEAREPLYAEVARQVIDTGTMSPLAAAAAIARTIAGTNAKAGSNA